MERNRTTLLLLGVGVALAGVVAVVARPRPLTPERGEPIPRGIDVIGPRLPGQPGNDLVARYGRPKYSQYLEELIVRDFFGDERKGVFVDVGAGDAIFNSTTAFLEKDLDWSGIAIDAEPKHRDGYVRERPASRFFAYFVGEKDGPLVDFYVNDREWRVSSGVKQFADSRGSSHVVKVPEITLNTLLDREGIRRIDFLSMDIEQAEPAALAGFDIRRFRPRLVCVELQSATKTAILAYMSRNGWVELERYRQFDSVNGWFAPGPGVPGRTPPTPRAAQK